MKCVGISWLLAIGLLASCSSESENPLAEGLSAAHQAQLKLRSFEEIEAIENFSPESFEALQRAHFETMTEDMRQRALENLPTRVESITGIQMSQTLRLDRESAEVEWRQLGPEKVAARVSVIGDRSDQTRDAAKTIKTRYWLPWIITVEKGELVLRHEGIRTSNL